MTINDSELNSLSNSWKRDNSTLVADGNAKINAFTTKMNSIWCSPMAKNFGEAIKDAFTKADTLIEKEISNINEVLNTNIKNFNGVEGTSISWSNLSFTAPQVANLSGKLNEKFSDGSVGTKEGSKATDLDPAFNELSDTYSKFFKDMKSTISGNDAFSPNQKASLTQGISNIESSFKKAIDNLKTDMHEQFSKEAEHVEELESTNKSNAEKLN